MVIVCALMAMLSLSLFIDAHEPPKGLERLIDRVIIVLALIVVPAGAWKLLTRWIPTAKGEIAEGQSQTDDDPDEQAQPELVDTVASGPGGASD